MLNKIKEYLDINNPELINFNYNISFIIYNSIVNYVDKIVKMENKKGTLIINFKDENLKKIVIGKKFINIVRID